MNKTAMTMSWDYFRTCNGVGLRAIALLPSDKLDAHPIANMRTPKELVVHVYQSVDEITRGIATGSISDFEAQEKAEAAKIHTTPELLAFCKERWDRAHRTMQGLTEAQADSIVKTPWGHDFPAPVMLQVLVNEYWHHRGQTYCQLRALGIAPPSLYDFEGNEAPFQQAQTSGA